MRHTKKAGFCFGVAALLTVAQAGAQPVIHVAPAAPQAKASGGAKAAAETVTVTPPAGFVAPKTSGGANLGSAQLYATMRAEGTLVEAQSKGTLPCTTISLGCGSGGFYRVAFSRDISACVYSVNPGPNSAAPGSILSFAPRHAVASVGTYGANVLIVFVFNADGNVVASPFSALVLC